ADPARPGSLAARWLAPAHADECDTSCNLCLRDFYNLPYHGLLDWRLAFDMVDMLRTPGFVPDLVTPRGGFTNPWARLVAGANAPVRAVLQRLGYQAPQAVGALTAYSHSDARRQLVRLERHPLWDDQNPVVTAAVGALAQQFPG